MKTISGTYKDHADYRYRVHYDRRKRKFVMRTFTNWGGYCGSDEYTKAEILTQLTGMEKEKPN